MTSARALPLRVDGVATIPAACVLELQRVPDAALALVAEAEAGAITPHAAFAIRFADDVGQPHRALVVVDRVEPAEGGRERCTLRLVAPPAPATGRGHPRTPVVVEVEARRIEADGQVVPVVVVDAAPGGLGIASFVLLREGEFVAFDDPRAGRIVAQVVRLDRRGEMWGYGVAFGNLERAAPFVESLLHAAQREAA